MMPHLLALTLLLAPPALAGAPSTRVAADDLVAAARGVLEKRSAGLPGEWRFQPVGDVADSRLDSDAPARVEAGDIDGPWPRRRVGVPVRIMGDDRLLQARVIWFDVEQWAEVPVYGRDAAAGTTRGELDVHLQRADLLAADRASAAHASTPTAETAAEQIARDRRLRHAVRAGMPVSATHFGVEHAVTRQARVVLAVRQGAVEVRVPATAQADADVGQPVKVLPLHGEQWVTGRVSGRNEVTIEN